MTASMTGFARHATEIGGRSLVWEIRSVNHRYLDLRILAPDHLRVLEPEMRALLQQSLARGKVDTQLRLENSTDPGAIHLDTARAQSLLRTLGEIDHMMVNGARVSPLEILSWPGVMQIDTPPAAEELHDSVLDGLRAALEDLQAMRSSEGAGLRTLLEERLAAFATLVGDVRSRRSAILSEQREKLLARVAELDLKLDPQRLEQEVALLSQRLDVAEELDRLDGHMAAMYEILKRDEPVGRRLDFLMQEFNREANTLSSKSHDLATTRAAMEMKILTEQMREQIQNIE
jgi:uncharacterized protein (TIGR00255 family)